MLAKTVNQNARNPLTKKDQNICIQDDWNGKERITGPGPGLPSNTETYANAVKSDYRQQGHGRQGRWNARVYYKNTKKDQDYKRNPKIGVRGHGNKHGDNKENRVYNPVLPVQLEYPPKNTKTMDWTEN